MTNDQQEDKPEETINWTHRAFGARVVVTGDIIKSIELGELPPNPDAVDATSALPNGAYDESPPVS